MENNRIISTGLHSLDTVLGGGFHSGSFTLLAGYPGVGKSSLALQIATAAARKSEHKILIFSLEMTAEQVKSRMQKQSGICIAEQESDIFIVDTPGVTTAFIADKLSNRNDIDMVVIDYLWLLGHSTDPASEQTSFAEQINALRQITKTFRIPLLCILPLSSSRRYQKHPTLQDLRHDIPLQDVDVLLSLYNNTTAPEKAERITEIAVLKNRYGDRNRLVKLKWNESTFTFT